MDGVRRWGSSLLLIRARGRSRVHELYRNPIRSKGDFSGSPVRAARNRC